MNNEIDYEQDFNTSEQEETEYTSQDTLSLKIPGARINPSKIETLSEIYTQYSQTEQKEKFLNKILEKDSPNKDSIEKNAKSAVYGTLMHNLQYFTDIFNATYLLGRIPSDRDFRTVFLNKKEEYYYALLKIMDKTIDQGLTEDPNLNAYIFWDIWRKNGQDFAPKKHKNFLINPQTIQYFWENDTIPREDLDVFFSSHKNKGKENIPFSANETFLLLNIYFPSCNLQIPTYIDKIEVEKGLDKPIKIIDYKTGEQFKKPDFRGKVQVFLMALATFITIIDRKKDIDYSISDWDIAHSGNNIPLPRLKKNNSVLRSSIYFNTIPEIANSIKKYITFSYVNPITLEEINIDLDTVFLQNTKETENILNYLNRLTDFYIQNKKSLRIKLSGKDAPFALPIFPKKGFLNDNPILSSAQLPFGF